MRTRNGARQSRGGRVLLRQKGKVCNRPRASRLRPTNQSLARTIQSRSPTICQPPHSAGHGDKDQCDEKQPRQQVCPPLSPERLTSNFAQNHSNLSRFRLCNRTQPASTKCGNPPEAI